MTLSNPGIRDSASNSTIPSAVIMAQETKRVAGSAKVTPIIRFAVSPAIWISIVSVSTGIFPLKRRWTS